MKLFERELSRSDLRAYTGNFNQIAGIKRFNLSEGKEKGTEIIEVRTGSGLRVWISPDRCLDIVHADFFDVAVSWDGPSGIVNPSYYDASESNWLRTATGGLLMTCGLTQVGKPGKDELGHYGLHGRIHHTPASQVSVNEEWEGNNCSWTISGIVEETAIFDVRLRLKRQIKLYLGKNKIEITDTIENIGFAKSPLMTLYHFNFGFPLLNEETNIEIPKASTVLGTSGNLSQKDFTSFQEPTPGFEEEVFYHKIQEQENVSVRIKTPNFPIAGQNRQLETELTWDAKTLPRLVQWKMAGQGDYVLGIEPSNCWTLGRSDEKELTYLGAQESVTNRLELQFNVN